MKVTEMGIGLKKAVFIPTGKFIWDCSGCRDIEGVRFCEFEGVTVCCEADDDMLETAVISALG